MRFYLHFSFLIFFAKISAAQTFSWCENGFLDNSSGGTFYNLSGTGIDLTISGLYNSECYYWWGGVHVKTGINNGIPQSVQHVYTFKYSAPVDIHFFIENITYGATFNHDDLLVFSGSPIFSEDYNVIVSEDSVYWNTAGWSPGSVKVNYYNTDSFSITHGRGNGFNPGFILIGPLVGPIQTALERNTEVDFSLFPNPNSGVFYIKQTEQIPYLLHIYNISGQLIYQKEIHDANERIEMPEAAEGIYIYRLQNSFGAQFGGKFIIKK
jgi:hypothetical protein